jgi:hypothetical protein
LHGEIRLFRRTIVCQEFKLFTDILPVQYYVEIRLSCQTIA